MNFKLLIIPAILLSFNSFSQKIDPKELPEGVSMTFKIKYSDITNAEWEKEGDDYVASFKQGGMATEASFFTSGQWKETEYEMPVKTLPSKIAEYVKSNYKDSKIKEFTFLDAIDGKYYIVEIKDSSKKEINLFFNLESTFVKQEIEENKNSDKVKK